MDHDVGVARVHDQIAVEHEVRVEVHARVAVAEYPRRSVLLQLLAGIRCTRGVEFVQDVVALVVRCSPCAVATVIPPRVHDGLELVAQRGDDRVRGVERLELTDQFLTSRHGLRPARLVVLAAHRHCVVAVERDVGVGAVPRDSARDVGGVRVVAELPVLPFGQQDVVHVVQRVVTDPQQPLAALESAIGGPVEVGRGRLLEFLAAHAGGHDVGELVESRLVAFAELALRSEAVRRLVGDVGPDRFPDVVAASAEVVCTVALAEVLLVLLDPDVGEEEIGVLPTTTSHEDVGGLGNLVAEGIVDHERRAFTQHRPHLAIVEAQAGESTQELILGDFVHLQVEVGDGVGGPRVAAGLSGQLGLDLTVVRAAPIGELRVQVVDQDGRGLVVHGVDGAEPLPVLPVLVHGLDGLRGGVDPQHEAGGLEQVEVQVRHGRVRGDRSVVLHVRLARVGVRVVLHSVHIGDGVTFVRVEVFVRHFRGASTGQKETCQHQSNSVHLPSKLIGHGRSYRIYCVLSIERARHMPGSFSLVLCFIFVVSVVRFIFHF